MTKQTTLMIQRLTRFGALLALIMGLSAWHYWQNERHDPSYEGTKLSKLLLNARYAPYDIQLTTRDEIHSLGTNAIPLCLEYLSIDESSAYRRGVDRLARISHQKLAIDSYTYIELGVAGFEALGPVAKPAAPALLNMITNRRGNSFQIARALGATHDSRAILLFQSYLKNADPNLRVLGLVGLEKMRESAGSLQTQLIWLSQNDPDPNVRANAATALGAQDNSKIIVPHLIYLLKNDTNTTVRFCAAAALGNFPEEAAQIRPILNSIRSGSPGSGARVGLTKLDEEESLNSLKGPANADLIRIRSQQR